MIMMALHTSRRRRPWLVAVAAALLLAGIAATVL